MIKRLNLLEETWPLCLHEFNQALLQLEPGQGLEIMVRDAEIGHQMEWLAEKAGGIRCSASYRDQVCRIRVFKE
jgi:TusA-related sulfurtransferase